MPIKISYDKLEEVPEAHRELYTEKDGKHLLTGVEGLKTQEDINRLQTALQKERTDHKETKQKLTPWSDLDHEEVSQKLDKFEEYKLLVEGKDQEIEEKVKALAEARTRAEKAPLERELKKLKEEKDESDKKLSEYGQKDRHRTIRDKVLKAATEQKIRSEALDDVLLLAESAFSVEEGNVLVKQDNAFGFDAGLTPDVWLTDMQSKRPHWWPPSEGAGSRGTGGVGGHPNNPWLRENWNMTEQGKLLREKGPEVAGQLAKLAGTTVGGKPAPAEKK